MKHEQKRHFWRKLILWVVGILLVLDLGGAAYFYHVAIVRSSKSFIKNRPVSKHDRLYSEEKWFQDAHKQHWTIMAANHQDQLVADYIPAAQPTNKTALICHGFMNRKESMGAYAAMFHQLGYNVLVPDARAHGKSQGKLIGYGWPERHDEQRWIQRIISHNGQRSQIVMFGVSMGGATTMMTSGTQLPHQVKAFIEDCGYDNVMNEINHEAHDLYHLPTVVALTFEKTMSLYNRVLNGFYLGDASSVEALRHNRRPMLFIHGEDDTFVPTKMVYHNYDATRGPKELWTVKGAAHAKSFQTQPRQYRQHVQRFLAKYVH